MKYTAYLLSSLATLYIVGTTTTTTSAADASSSSTSTHQLRGSEEGTSSITAPPRIFFVEEEEEHSVLLHDTTTTILLQSSSSSSHPEEQTSRALQSSCNSNEQSLQIILLPDTHSKDDNSFTISIRQQTNNWSKLHTQHATTEMTQQSFHMCLSSSGKYRFEAIDSYSDGIDNGYYEVRLDGTTIFTTPVGSGGWSRSVHKFDVVLTNEDGVEEQQQLQQQQQQQVTPEDETNDVEDEPELQLLLKSGATEIPTSTIVLSSPNVAPVTTKKPTMKPTSQPISSTGSTVGGDGGGTGSTGGSTPPPSSKPTPKPTPAAEPSGTSSNVSTGQMTEREHQWLDEHNKRREKYHKQKGTSYVPLQWSAYLRDSAKQWAEECARTGVFDHAWHLNIGENMARHTTPVEKDGYRHPSNILTRWVEDEMNDGYPDNGHMTQVLWRATKFVGCGEARKGNRYYQVCQYSKPGNCGVNRNNFWDSVLKDDTVCKGMPLLY